MELFIIGLNHRTAPVALRETLAIPATNLPALLQSLRSEADFAEAVVVNTCNRCEVYGVAPSHAATPERVLTVLNQFSSSQPADAATILSCLYVHRGEACVRHLFRVASSLDSLVVGETEIVGQIKSAYQTAQAVGTTGKLLHRLFQKAFSVSKEVRTRSGIGRCSTSVGAVCVDLAGQIFGDNLSGHRVLIIGAGQMSETTLRHLAKRGVGGVVVLNRSLERAEELAAQFQGRALSFSELPAALAEADIVVSSTSAPHYVLGKSELVPAMNARKGRPLFLIDLAVPRDIDPSALELENVYLYNIDQLSDLAQQNMQRRQHEAVLCETLVRNEAATVAQRLLHPVPALPWGLAEKTRFPQCLPLLRRTWFGTERNVLAR